MIKRKTFNHDGFKPTSDYDQRKKRFAQLLAIATLSICVVNTSGCEPYDSITKAEKISENIENELKPGGEVEVAPMIVTFDEGLNFRSTPLVVNTHNNSWTTGNRYGYDIAPLNIHSGDSSSVRPMIMVRPMVVKNKDDYWLGGIQGGEIVWVNAGKEAQDRMTFFTMDQDEEEQDVESEQIMIQEVSVEDGIVFDAGGFNKSAGLMRYSSELEVKEDPYIDAMRQEGYKEVDFPLGG